MSAEKERVCVFAIFLGALLGFAIAYHPVNAVSRPADQAVPSVMPVGKPLLIKAPLGLPPVPVPADNPPTAETVALGRLLYYDPALSADNTISCASCHAAETGFTDTRPVSIGVGGKKGTRHSPTVINSAYNYLQFWDGRAPSLEEQAKGPMINPVEMATTHADVVQRLQADPKYVALFKEAWGTDQITIDLVVKSIASFERTVLSGNAPFDRFYYGHDKKALSASAKRGFKLFVDPKKGNCAVCHRSEKNTLYLPITSSTTLESEPIRGGTWSTSAASSRPKTKPTGEPSRLPRCATLRNERRTCTMARSPP